MARRKKPQEQELGDLASGRFRARFPDWWQAADPADLAAAHARAAQLVAGGYGAISPDQWGPWPGCGD